MRRVLMQPQEETATIPSRGSSRLPWTRWWASRACSGGARRRFRRLSATQRPQHVSGCGEDEHQENLCEEEVRRREHDKEWVGTHETKKCKEEEEAGAPLRHFAELTSGKESRQRRKGKFWGWWTGLRVRGSGNFCGSRPGTGGSI